jgi:hypothetical protein
MSESKLTLIAETDPDFWWWATTRGVWNTVITDAPEWFAALEEYARLKFKNREARNAVRAQELRIMRLMKQLGGRRVIGAGRTVSINFHRERAIPAHKRPEALRIEVAEGEDTDGE